MKRLLNILCILTCLTYPVFVGITVHKISELKKENDTLNRRVTTLEAQVSTLKRGVLGTLNEIRDQHYPEYLILPNGDIIHQDAFVMCVECHGRVR